MTNEEQLEDTTNSTSQEEQVDAKPEAQEGSPELSKDSSTDNKIDYAAELAIERKKREDAEAVIASEAFKKREAKRAEVEDEEEERLTPSQVREMIKQETQMSVRIAQENQASVMADKLASEPAEKELIIERWKVRSFPAGMSLEEQIEETFAIVNRKKLISERNEALRALKGKEQVNDNSASTHHDGPKVKEPAMGADVKQVLAQQGFTFNANSRQFEKKLANGKLLIKDPKTGKVYQQGLSQAPIGA